MILAGLKQSAALAYVLTLYFWYNETAMENDYSDEDLPGGFTMLRVDQEQTSSSSLPAILARYFVDLAQACSGSYVLLMLSLALIAILMYFSLASFISVCGKKWFLYE